MKCAPFTYHDPRTLPEVVDLLGRLENAKLLAGGQSLMAMMNMRYGVYDHLVDLNCVEELAGITLAGDRLSIGAMTRQVDLMRSPLLARTCPIAGAALRNVGHVPTRNRGTIGGSHMHLDPAAELPGVSALLEAELCVRSARGERSIPIAALPITYMTPAVEPDEVLTRIDWRIWPEGHGYAFQEFAHRPGDFAVVGVGVLLAATSDHRRIARAAIALVGVGPGPQRLTAVESLLSGQEADRNLFEEAARQAGAIDAMEDALVTANYRRRLARVLTGRALRQAWARAINLESEEMLHV